MPPPKILYLLSYNALSALLWSSILIQLLSHLLTNPPSQIYNYIGTTVRWTQTLALLEVIHSALGLVRSPLPTTILQVSSRLFLVHAIVHPFRDVAGRGNPFYASMVLAWSVTEVIRYTYFVVTLPAVPVGSAGSGKKQAVSSANSAPLVSTPPSSSWDLKALLTWARYNTFFILYPIGIGSEVMCIWRAMGEMARLSGGDVGISSPGELYGLGWWACVGILGVYVPGGWVLYTYMMAQRRKVMSGMRKGKGREVVGKGE